MWLLLTPQTEAELSRISNKTEREAGITYKWLHPKINIPSACYSLMYVCVYATVFHVHFSATWLHMNVYGVACVRRRPPWKHSRHCMHAASSIINSIEHKFTYSLKLIWCEFLPVLVFFSVNTVAGLMLDRGASDENSVVEFCTEPQIFELFIQPQ